MFKNLKIGMKLILAFGVIVLILASSMLLALTDLKDLSADLRDIGDVSVPVIDDAWSVRRNLVAIQRELYKAIVSSDPKEISECVALVREEVNGVKTILNDMKAIYRGNMSDFDVVNTLMNDTDTYMEQIINLVLKNDAEENAKAYMILKSNYDPAFEKVNDRVVEMYDGAKDRATVKITDAEKSTTISTLILLALTVFSIAFASLIGLAITRSIARPIKEVGRAADKLSKGILNAEIAYESKDEIGSMAESMRNAMKSFQGYISDIDNAMSEMANGNFDVAAAKPFEGDFANIERSIDRFIINMSGTLTQIGNASDQVNSGATQVASTAQALAQGATEQASSVEQLSAAIGGVAIQVQKNAENSTTAKNKSENASREIENSNHKMQELMVAMQDINEKSNQISKIIKAIEDIAFQTNILALNAAVEAARAGAAGKGFAVVADEVRNLATKSSEAAKDTTALIESSILAVSAGTKIATETASELIKIVEGSKETTELIGNVSKASNEQSEVIEKINQGIDQISTVVQTNSATSEESAAASEELSSQAVSLKALVSKFRVRRIEGSAAKAISNVKEPVRQIMLDEPSGTSKY